MCCKRLSSGSSRAQSDWLVVNRSSMWKSFVLYTCPYTYLKDSSYWAHVCMESVTSLLAVHAACSMHMHLLWSCNANVIALASLITLVQSNACMHCHICSKIYKQTFNWSKACAITALGYREVIFMPKVHVADWPMRMHVPAWDLRSADTCPIMSPVMYVDQPDQSADQSWHCSASWGVAAWTSTWRSKECSPIWSSDRYLPCLRLWGFDLSQSEVSDYDALQH